MHEGLGLRCARIQHAAGGEEDVEDVCVCGGGAGVPGYEGRVASQTFDVDHFFGGDGELGLSVSV